MLGLPHLCKLRKNSNVSNRVFHKLDEIGNGIRKQKKLEYFTKYYPSEIESKSNTLLSDLTWHLLLRLSL